MIDIYEVSLLDLLPSNLKNDPDVIAASKTMDEQFFITVNEVKECIVLPRVDEQPHEVLDLLAWEAHLDYYDTSLPLEIKRELIKKSPALHRMKGTPAAVEELVTTLFDEGKVVEWFEYGDTPYRFRVETNNTSVTNERAQEFIKALESVKNIRSTLDRVIINQKENMDLYFAGVVHTGDKVTVRQVI